MFEQTDIPEFLRGKRPEAGSDTANATTHAETIDSPLEMLVSVRARGGEEVAFSRAAAAHAGTLSDWIEVTGGHGAFPAPVVAVAALRLIAAVCEEKTTGPGDGGVCSLTECSLIELAEVVTGANFLAARAAAERASLEFDRRLNGKSLGEMREALGVAADLSEAEVAAALAEPTFMPPGSACAAKMVVGADDGPPAAQRSLSSAMSEDALEEALSEVQVKTLLRLKGVSTAWRTRARRELCARFCGRGGQRASQPHAQLDEITDLDVEALQSVGPKYSQGLGVHFAPGTGDVVSAGRLLPGLARLHGWGFAVDVAAVRALDLSEDGPPPGEELHSLQTFPRLRGCVVAQSDERAQGDEGAPPLELLLLAAACAASGHVCGVPVQALREDASLTELDLSERNMFRLGRLDNVSARLLAKLLLGNASLTELKIVSNRIGSEGTTAIAAALTSNAVLTALHLSGNRIGAEGAIAIAEALKLNTTLTDLAIVGCEVGDVGALAITRALQTNKVLTSLVVGDDPWNNDCISAEVARQLAATVLASPSLEAFNALPLKELRAATLTEVSTDGAELADCLVLAGLAKANKAVLTSLALNNDPDFSPGIGPLGAEAIAEVITASPRLTRLDVDDNPIRDAGASAIAEALKGNPALTELSMAIGTRIGPPGAAAIAEALKVNTVLRKLDLDGPFNPFGPSGVAAIAEALKVNAGLTALSLEQVKIDPSGAAAIGDALKANRVLTELNLSTNLLCGIDPYSYRGTYTAAGIEAIAEALKVNHVLTTLKLGGNNIRSSGASAIAEALKVNAGLTALNLSRDAIGPSGAAATADALKANRVLTELDLCYSMLCGIQPVGGRGTYTAAGIEAIAEALKGSRLTKLDLHGNHMREEAEAALRAAAEPSLQLILTEDEWRAAL